MACNEPGIPPRVTLVKHANGYLNWQERISILCLVQAPKQVSTELEKTEGGGRGRFGECHIQRGKAGTHRPLGNRRREGRNLRPTPRIPR